MGHAPENTIASIKKALELGVDCIEIDVYSIEGHLLVFHDQRLERTSNGAGFIWDHTFEYLRTLDAGDGEQIPTLAEVWQTIQGRVGLNIELKGPGTATPVVEFITHQTKQGHDKRIFLISAFDHSALAEVKKLDSDIKIGVLLKGSPQNGPQLAAEFNAYAVHPAAETLDKNWVDQAHARGLRIFTYTVNHPQQIQTMKHLGVDGIFTNCPERVIHKASRKLNIGWP